MNFDLTLADYAVLQRNEHDRSAHPVSGHCRAAGRLLLSVNTADKQPLPGFQDRAIGSAASGHFRGVVADIPVGGPYTLRFTVAGPSGSVLESAVVREILVGDLWCMAGQSNMQGYGNLPGLTPPDPRIHNYYMDNRWGIAKDPLHNLWQAAARVHGGNPAYPTPRNLAKGAGPGLSFAAMMLEHTGVPQGLIACAHGGTSMMQWDPALRNKGDDSLYGAAANRIRRLGGRIAGVIWYQGCNDTGSAEAVRAYTPRMKQLIAAFRRDARNPRLPVVIAQLGRHMPGPDPDRWTAIRDQQCRFCRTMPFTALAPTVDLELDDQIHLSNRAQQTLGRRMAGAMLHLLGLPGGVAPIVPLRCRLSEDPALHTARYIVDFANVKGNLGAAGRPAGFSMLINGGDQGGCFRVEPVGGSVIVHTAIPYFLAANYELGYAVGDNPYCNLVDENGTPLPGFVIRPRMARHNYTAMASKAEVSEPLYIPEGIEQLTYPGHPEKLTFVPAYFSNFYLEHPRRAELGTLDEKVFYFRFRISLAEAMTLKVLAGSDGPFVLYCDRRELMREVTANPLVADEFSTEVTLEKGVHEFLFAMSSNTGHAWGVCCRFRRMDDRRSEILPEYV